MSTRGFSLVELVGTLVLSAVTVLFALYTTVVTVRSTQRASVTRALSIEAEIATLRFLEDAIRVGTHGVSRAETALTVSDDEAITFTLPARADVVVDDTFVLPTERERVTWRRVDARLLRTSCEPREGGPCVDEMIVDDVERFAVVLIDAQGAQTGIDRAARARFSLTLRARGSDRDAPSASVVDEVRLGGPQP